MVFFKPPASRKLPGKKTHHFCLIRLVTCRCHQEWGWNFIEQKCLSVDVFFNPNLKLHIFWKGIRNELMWKTPLSGVDSYTQHGEWLGGMFEPTLKQTYPRLPSLPNVRYGMCFFSSSPKTLAFWKTKPQQLMTWKNYGILTHISSRGFSNVCLCFFRSFQWSPVTKTGWWFQIVFIHTLIWSGEDSHFD